MGRTPNATIMNPGGVGSSLHSILPCIDQCSAIALLRALSDEAISRELCWV